MPELVLQRVEGFRGDGRESLLVGSVLGMDHAAQCPLRLHQPDSARVALGAVLEVTQEMSLMPMSV
jgi:hypothetical protein